ncbi:hypothetical protein F4808DRAFT_469484 [Astrocystis sublimbata]|nr:hypothetical protein F4808DRAFT_469484 [Astrocystis sublimbata]
MAKYYGVRKGRVPGVYENWNKGDGLLQALLQNPTAPDAEERYWCLGDRAAAALEDYMSRVHLNNINNVGCKTELGDVDVKEDRYADSGAPGHDCEVSSIHKIESNRPSSPPPVKKKFVASPIALAAVEVPSRSQCGTKRDLGDLMQGRDSPEKEATSSIFHKLHQT